MFHDQVLLVWKNYSICMFNIYFFMHAKWNKNMRYLQKSDNKQKTVIEYFPKMLLFQR